MTTTNPVHGAASVYPAFPDDMSDVSPDALLEYCQTQLGGLDSQITDQFNMQNQLLQERTAVEHVQTVLESYGTDGPTDGGPGMQQCVTAFQSAIASLPSGDPVAGQLSTQLAALTSQYNYSAGGQPVTDADGNPTGQLTGPSASNPQTGDWKGTTDALSNLVQDVSGSTDIDMLKLQDLVSQRQQAVELCSGIMTKEDDTLESQAKGIGQ